MSLPALWPENLNWILEFKTQPFRVAGLVEPKPRSSGSALDRSWAAFLHA